MHHFYTYALTVLVSVLLTSCVMDEGTRSSLVKLKLPIKAGIDLKSIDRLQYAKALPKGGGTGKKATPLSLRNASSQKTGKLMGGEICQMSFDLASLAGLKELIAGPGTCARAIHLKATNT